jgi:hypothetical protein
MLVRAQQLRWVFYATAGYNQSYIKSNPPVASYGIGESSRGPAVERTTEKMAG